jgi:hypothetical protein
LHFLAKLFLTFFFPVLSETGFQSGTPCDLFAEEPGVIQQLSSGDYGYDSDSDLESISDEDGTGIEEAPTVELDALSIGEEGKKHLCLPGQGFTSDRKQLPPLLHGLGSTSHRRPVVLLMHLTGRHIERTTQLQFPVESISSS